MPTVSPASAYQDHAPSPPRWHSLTGWLYALIERFPWLFVGYAASLLWIFSWSIPLFPPDEGRYGMCSLNMVHTGNYMVPMLAGQPHLTKPPLTYWLQALAIKVLGNIPLAVRLPSLLAGTLTLCLAFWFVRRRYASVDEDRGLRRAMLTVGAMSILPLFVVVCRLGITDPLLMLFWTAGLIYGLLAVDEPQKKRWPILMWTAIALGWLTKGPLALMPAGLIIIWLLVGGRAREVRKIRPIIGVILSILPLVLWVGYVIWKHSDAVEIWKHEMVDRVTGENGGDHPQQFWYYIPVLLGGFFPITAMLTLPGWNVKWKSCWAMLRSGSDLALWIISVIVPFLLFTSMTGKLATYLLPIAFPLALANTFVIERWLNGRAEREAGRIRTPELVVTLFIASICTAGAAIWFAQHLEAGLLPYSLGVLILPLGALIVMIMWKKSPQLRPAALLMILLTGQATWIWAYTLESAIRKPSDPMMLITMIRQSTGKQMPVIGTVGFRDNTISYMLGAEVLEIRKPVTLLQEDNPNAQADAIAAQADTWARTVAKNPELSQQFREIGTWVHWTNDKVKVLVRVHSQPGRGP